MEIISIQTSTLMSILLGCTVVTGFILYGLPLFVSLHGLWPTHSERVFKQRFAKHLLVFAAFMQIIVLLLLGAVLVLIMPDVPKSLPGVVLPDALPRASADFVSTFLFYLQNPITLGQVILYGLFTLCAVCAFLIGRYKSPWWCAIVLALFWTACQTVFLLLLETNMRPTPSTNIFEEILFTLRYTVFVMADFFEPDAWLFWRLRIVLFACMSSGAMALIWLVLRRSRDDFGRDYYAYAARVAARFALFASVMLSLGHLIGLLFAYPQPMLASPLLEGFQFSISSIVLIGVGIQLFGALLWFLVQRSATPMRHKIAIVCGGLCVISVAILWFVGPILFVRY